MLFNILKCIALLSLFAIVLTACLDRCIELRDQPGTKLEQLCYQLIVLCCWAATVFFGIAPLWTG